jgi:hypothetical protein
VCRDLNTTNVVGWFAVIQTTWKQSRRGAATLSKMRKFLGLSKKSKSSKEEPAKKEEKKNEEATKPTQEQKIERKPIIRSVSVFTGLPWLLLQVYLCVFTDYRDINCIIFSYLEPNELTAISTVCKDFAEWANSDVCVFLLHLFLMKL